MKPLVREQGLAEAGFNARMRHVAKYVLFLAGLSTALLSGAGCVAQANKAQSHQLDHVGHAAIVAELGQVAGLGASGDDCSALVLRAQLANGGSSVVAALTAAHCLEVSPAKLAAYGGNLKGDPSQWETWRPGDDGKTYVIEAGSDQTVKIGTDTRHMQTVGTASEILVATDGNTDQALLVMPGYSPKQALAIYNGYLASSAQLGELKPGDPIEVAGWPADQPTAGYETEQSFLAAYVDSGTVQLDGGGTMSVAWIAVPRNPGGETCFYGLSGAGAYNAEQAANGGNITVVGTLYGVDFPNRNNNDLNPNDPNAPPVVQANPHFPWSKYASLCAVATTRLTEGDITVLYPVASLSQVPGQRADIDSKRPGFGPVIAAAPAGTASS